MRSVLQHKTKLKQVRILNVVLRLTWGCFWKLKQHQDTNQKTPLFQYWNNIISTKKHFEQHHSNLKIMLFQLWNPTLFNFQKQPRFNIISMSKYDVISTLIQRQSASWVRASSIIVITANNLIMVLFIFITWLQTLYINGGGLSWGVISYCAIVNCSLSQ